MFPDRRPPSPKWRPVAIAVIALSVAGTLGSVLQLFDVGDPDNPTAVASLEPVLEPLLTAILFASWRCWCSAVSVVVRSRRARARTQQLRWLVVVAVLSAVLLARDRVRARSVSIGDPLGSRSSRW
jgi:hypothetical protein